MARSSATYIEGLNPVLRSFGKLGKEANKELRQASREIADKHMVTAYRKAALGIRNKKWGRLQADAIRSGSDRMPYVKIGKKKIVTSGGASTIILRYPTDTGEKGKSFAPFVRNNWLSKAKGDYIEPAIQEWSDALNAVAKKWNRNGI